MSETQKSFSSSLLNIQPTLQFQYRKYCCTIFYVSFVVCQQHQNNNGTFIYPQDYITLYFLNMNEGVNKKKERERERLKILEMSLREDSQDEFLSYAN